MRAGFIVLLGALSLNALAVPGYSSSYNRIAEEASNKIKRFDAEVRQVKTIFGQGAGVRTNCGMTNNSRSEAFYCGNKKSAVIVFSKAALVHIGNRFGKETVQAVVAHEYGHARQHAVQGFTSKWIWSNSVDEIQADCIAGVYMANVMPPMTEKKLDEVSDFFKVIGDYVFYEKDWHGTPEMRSASFRMGYRSRNLKGCLAASEANLSDINDMADEVIEQAPGKIDKMIRWGQDILK